MNIENRLREAIERQVRGVHALNFDQTLLAEMLGSVMAGKHSNSAAQQSMVAAYQYGLTDRIRGDRASPEKYGAGHGSAWEKWYLQGWRVEDPSCAMG